jgi:hypothetical protein
MGRCGGRYLARPPRGIRGRDVAITKRTTITIALLALASAGSVGALSVFALPRPAPDAAVIVSGPEPEPEIPGLMMQDVRDLEYLWHGIRELERLRQQGRIDTEEYRYKVIELSAEYLQIQGDAADEFAHAAAEEIVAVRESFLRMRQGSVGYQTFRADMDAAAKRLNALLEGKPRHALFEPECGKWLRRLALGPAFESEQDQAGLG